MRCLAPTLAALALAVPALAQDTDLELVLLADASNSIDQSEILFQRSGYAEALRDKAVLEAISNTLYGSIAITYVEWASEGTEDVVVGWTLIDGPEAAAAFADQLLAAPRRAFGRNSIGAALLFGKRLIETNEIEGWRRVIDFSGDSANSYSGPAVGLARAEVLAAGITINGLAVLCRNCSGAPRAGLAERYEAEIIGGPGSFVVAATDDADFARAVRRKLILEISGAMPASRYAAAER